MKKNAKFYVGILTLFLCGILTSQASVLTFGDTITNEQIPEDWGSNIAAGSGNWDISNGATPNISLAWTNDLGSTSQRWDFYNDSEWAGVAQLNDFNQGTSYYLTFAPDAGYAVILDSFVFDDYAGWGEPTNSFSWNVRQDSTNGTIIASGSAVTDDGENLTVNTGMTSSYGGAIVLEIFNNSIGLTGDDQAIDDVTFRQQLAAAADPAEILEISAGPSGTMRLVIDLPEEPVRYWPEAQSDLLTGTWTNVAHSVDGAPPWYMTNLSYVVEYDTSFTNGMGEFTHEVIYVNADDAQKFFRIISPD